MNILVTGASGFIGRYLIQHLLTIDNVTVTGLVRKTSDISKLSHPRLTYTYADISDARSLTNAFDGTQKFDVIYHCAAFVDNKPLSTLTNVNVTGTRNICELTLRLNIPRMVYVSSVAVVSGNPDVPLTEDLPYRATNPYGESKIEAEKIVRGFRDTQFTKKNIRVAIFRPPIVYGPDEPHMTRLILRALRLRLIPILSGGTNRIRQIYVKNLAQALVECLDNDEFFKGEFFVADTEVLTVREFFTLLAKGVNSKPWDMPDWITNILISINPIGKKIKFFLKDRVYSTQKIENLGFKPRYSAYHALEQSARDFK